MNYYLINTNRCADPSGQDEQSMLNGKFVALYFDGYKEKLDLLQDGDVVFLYSNSNGIIAFGEVLGPTIKNIKYKGMNKFENEEFRRGIGRNFVELQKPFTSKEIKRIFGKRIVLAKAFLKIDEQIGAVLHSEIRNASQTHLKAA